MQLWFYVNISGLNHLLRSDPYGYGLRYGKTYSAVDILTTAFNDNPDPLIKLLYCIVDLYRCYQLQKYGLIVQTLRANIWRPWCSERSMVWSITNILGILSALWKTSARRLLYVAVFCNGCDYGNRLWIRHMVWREGWKDPISDYFDYMRGCESHEHGIEHVLMVLFVID